MTAAGRTGRVFVLLIVGLLTLSLVAGSGLGASGTTNECAIGSGGGPIYATDSGLEVEDNDTRGAGPPYPTFPDAETLVLAAPGYANVTFSAEAPAELRLEERQEDRTCLAAIDATGTVLTVTPEDGQPFAVTGAIDALTLHTVDFEVTDEPDLATTANESFAFTLYETGLDEDTTVFVESVDDGSVELEGMVAGDGSVGVVIPDGEHRLAIHTVVDDGGSGGAIPPPPPPPPPRDEPAAFELADLSVEPLEVHVGDSIVAAATVTNVGDEQGTHALELWIDDAVVATENVSLDGGASETIGFEHAFEEPGAFAVSIDGQFVESVTVTAAPEPADETDGDDGVDDAADETDTAPPTGTDDEARATDAYDEDDGMPGFGVVLALVGVLSVLALAARGR